MIYSDEHKSKKQRRPKWCNSGFGSSFVTTNSFREQSLRHFTWAFKRRNFISDAAAKLFGYSKKELIEIGRDGIVSNDELEVNLIAEQMRFGKAVGPMNFRKKDGRNFKGMVYTNLINDNSGSHFKSINIIDVSEFEKLDLEVRERNKYLNTLLNHSSDYMSVVDRFGKRKLISKSAERILGYTEDELAALGPLELVHKEDRELVWHCFTHVAELESGLITEARLVHKDGHSVMFAWSFSLDRETGDICSVGRDITRIKRVEEELQKSKLRLNVFLEFATDAILVHDFEGNITDANNQACSATG